MNFIKILIFFINNFLFIFNSNIIYDSNIYSDSLIDIMNIYLNYTGNFNLTYSANFHLDIVVVSNSQPPVTYRLDTIPLTHNYSTFLLPQNVSISVKTPHNYLDVYAVSVFSYNNPSYPGILNISTKILEMTMNNYTQEIQTRTLLINNLNNTVHGYITFDYLKHCKDDINNYGFNCIYCNSENVDGTCFTCDHNNGTRVCCPGYYYFPYCVNSTYTTTVSSDLEHTTTNNDEKLKKIYFWIMIGLAILSLLLLLLLLLCCFLCLRYKNDKEETEMKLRNAKKINQQRISHPHFSEAHRTVLPPYRPPRTSPHHTRANSQINLPTQYTTQEVRYTPDDDDSEWSHQIVRREQRV